MQIVDAHHHLWDPRGLHYELLDGPLAALRRPFRMTEYADVAAASGVIRSVCVEAASAGASGSAETAWLLAETASSSLGSAIVAWAPVESPALGRWLDYLASGSAGRVTGVRRSLEFVPSDFVTDSRVVEGVRQVGQRGLVFDLVLFPENLRAAIELVARCPDVQFVLDHLGKPQLVDGDTAVWSTSLHQLSQLPNVACKISGLLKPDERAPRTPAGLRPYIEHAIGCFGWHRVLFGSDWPLCELAGGYAAWLELLNACLGAATDVERSMLFSDNASRIYRLPTLSGAEALIDGQDHRTQEEDDVRPS